MSHRVVYVVFLVCFYTNLTCTSINPNKSGNSEVGKYTVPQLYNIQRLGEVVGVGKVVFIVRVGGGGGEALMTVIETQREGLVYNRPGHTKHTHQKGVIGVITDSSTDPYKVHT